MKNNSIQTALEIMLLNDLFQKKVIDEALYSKALKRIQLDNPPLHSDDNPVVLATA